MTGTAAQTFSRTDLTRKTREILEEVRRSGTAVIESYGKAQAVLLDPLDHQLLRALAGLPFDQDGAEDLRSTLQSYLREEISLGKTAEVLGISRFELMERFERLGVPLQLGPRDASDARAEIQAALPESTDPATARP